MNFVKALNEIDARVWGVILVVLGLVAFGITCFCHAADVRAAMLAAAATMTGGGIGLIQNKPATPHTPPTNTPV